MGANPGGDTVLDMAEQDISITTGSDTRRVAGGRGGHLTPFTSETARLGHQARAERRELRREAFIRGLVQGVGATIPDIKGDVDMVAAIGDAVGQVAVMLDDRRMIQAASLALKVAGVTEDKQHGPGDAPAAAVTMNVVAVSSLADLLALVQAQK